MRFLYVALLAAALGGVGCKSKEDEAKEKLERKELVQKAEMQATFAVNGASDKTSADKAEESIKTLEDLDPTNPTVASLRKKLREAIGCVAFVDAVPNCSARVVTNAGKTWSWTVTKPGTYDVKVTATGKDKFLSLWPKVTITQGSKTVAEGASEDGEPVKVSAAVEKGTYDVLVSDVSGTHIEKLKGGAGFTIAIDSK